jgi:outer membrane receptor protein involved in Fe transport
MRRRRLVLRALTVVVMLFSLVPPAAAQRTTATFAGIVTDTSGGVLPGTDVELANEGTGIVERQVTSVTGEFIFNYVPGGTYTLTISLSGFRTYRAAGIAIGAAQNVRRTYQLEVGAMAENITVSGDAPLINTASPEQRISLDTLEVKTLPAANRNLTNLLNIGTGLTRQEGTVEGGGSGSGGAGGIRLRLNGLGGAAMSITANGTDASANAGARQISQYNGISKIDIVSIESVGEVQIVKGISPAEFGHALAGNLNIVTKAGTNAFHGSLFHRYEGAALVSKPFFLREKPDSKWNQGGGSLGGPLMRDKGFFFAAVESYRLKRALELNVNVPTQRFRDLLMTALPYPETKLLLDQYLLPTEPTAPNALLGVFIGAGNKENNDDHVDTRADFRIKGGNLSGTFTYGHPFLTQESQLPGQPRVWVSLTRRASASYAVARGNWSSETRFGYNYNWLSRTDPFYNVLDPVNPGPIDINAKNRRQIPSISFPGLLTLGSEQHTRGQQPSYSFEQQATLIAGKHSFKVGGIYATPRGGRFNVTGPSFSFTSEADILANRPSSISFRLRPVQGLWTTTNWGLFAQDDWRVNSKLVINMGVRYDWFSRYMFEGTDPENPAGIVNLDGAPDPSFRFGAVRSADRIFEDDAKINLGPRAGFAYNPDGGGRTVLSGGWGMMFQPLDTQNFETSIGMISGIPATTNFSAVEAANLNLHYPIYNEDMLVRYQGIYTPSPLSPVGLLIDPNIQAPYAQVFTGGIQHAFGKATVVDAAYVGTRGYNFRMARTYNEPDRLTGIRPNTSLSQATYVDDSQRTTYNSLQTSMRQRFSSRLQVNLNYTLSSTRANYDGDNTLSSVNDASSTVQNFFDLESNWGPAIGDVRHSFIGSVIYETPGTSWSSPVARHLLGGWQISSIFRARSGEPLIVTQSSSRAGSRPDVIDAAGAINSQCCDINNNVMQYLNPAAFRAVPLNSTSRQTIRAGNVGVGQFRLPGLKNLDLSLGKSFSVGGGRRIEIRADMLNALNWINYAAVQTNITASDFGRITGTGAARVVQLQARFSF